MDNTKYKVIGLAATLLLALLLPAYILYEPHKQAKFVEERRQEWIEVAQVIWKQDCAACHGPNGEGGVGPALNDRDFLNGVTDEFLYKTIARGRPGTLMAAKHKDEGGNLNEEEIWAMITLLRSWQETAPQVRAAERTTVKDPAQLYKSDCVACHGENREGATGPALDQTNSFIQPDNLDAIIDVITNGRPGTPMPAWGLRWNNEQIRLVATWLVEQAGYEVAPPPVDGKTVYEQNCLACHGPKGEGGVGKAFVDNPFVSPDNRDAIKETILKGRPGTAMPAWEGRLTDAEIEAVIDYILQLAQGGGQ